MAGNAPIRIGVLALQGAVEPHEKHLRRLGAEPVQVRKPNHLLGLKGLVLPGGESTTMLHLLHLNELWEPLRDFVAMKPVFGVCAGAILLARQVTHPEQESLGVLDLVVARNAYGRQVNSFCAALKPTSHWKGEGVEGVFIRAPRFTQVGPEARVLFEHDGEPVCVEQGALLAASFHPELTDSLALHRHFYERCLLEETPWMTASQGPYAGSSVN